MFRRELCMAIHMEIKFFMNRRTVISWLAAALAVLATSSSTRAQFQPLTLTPESLNFDIVVESGATHPFQPSTTASMDGGTNNTGYVWYQQGYNTNALDSGLPIAGSSITNDLADHVYTLSANYGSNNAVLIDANHT